MLLSLRYRELIKPFFLLLLLLLSTQLLSFCNGRRIMAREVVLVRTRVGAKPSSPSTGYFSQSFSKEEGDELDPLYGVSKRFVPQGPNPLHN